MAVFFLLRFDPDVIQDPTVYRFYEAIMHNGEILKSIINGKGWQDTSLGFESSDISPPPLSLHSKHAEECGDGIMSAIDMYTTVDTVSGKHVRHTFRRFTLSVHGQLHLFLSLNHSYTTVISTGREEDCCHILREISDIRGG